jgi:hypothetical protein
METAVVGVFGALIGILISNGLALLLDIRRRREKVKDVQTSLRAEMRTHWRRLEPLEMDARAALILARMKDTSRPFTPFIPREEPTPIFDAVVREIHLLPTSVIDPVVLFYSKHVALLNFVDDLRGGPFAELERDRQVQMYEDYITMQKQARDLAEEAIGAIDAALDDNET